MAILNTVQTFWAEIYMAGDYDDAIRLCRRHTMAVGLCVTVEKCAFVYTGGMEDGVRIGLVNYPRFPSTPEEIEDKARNLAELLRTELCQNHALVVTPNRTTWLGKGEE